MTVHIKVGEEAFNRFLKGDTVSGKLITVKIILKIRRPKTMPLHIYPAKKLINTLFTFPVNPARRAVWVTRHFFSASAPPTMSINSFVIVAWRTLL